MVLYVARHGESVSNIEKRYGGKRDVLLTQRGIEQARELIEKLSDIGFEVIVTSSLLRARHTAEIINEALRIPLIVSDDFQERSFGVYEGLTQEEVMEKYPDLYKRKCTRQLDDAPTNGETYRQFDERIRSARAGLEKEYYGQKVLLVTHGFVARIINSYYKDLSFEEMLEFDLGNCEIIVYGR